MVTSLALLLLLLLILFPTPLLYSLCLIFSVLLMLYSCLVYLWVSPLFSLLVLIVYIGAMMVVISYISATCPNMNPLSTPTTYLLGALSFVGWLAVSFLDLGDMQESSSIITSVSDFFYLGVGIWIFVVLVLFMFLFLIICSYLVIQKAPLRSV